MYQEGYFTGVTDIYAADMTTEDTPTTPAAYGVPYVVAKTIGITVTPTYKTNYEKSTPHEGLRRKSWGVKAWERKDDFGKGWRG